MAVRRRTLSLAVLLAAAPALPAQAEDGTPPRPELTLERRFLEDLSTWQQHLTCPEGQPIDKRVRGVFPVGDGHVFTYLGLGRRANTMQALTGPHYQTAEVRAPKGHWGELSLDLVEGGEVVPLPEQSLWRSRGVNVVITEDATPRRAGKSDLSLYTVNWATPGTDTIYRWVEVRNRGAGKRRLSLRATWERGSARAGGRTLGATYAAKGFEAELAASGDARAEGRRLTIGLGEVAPGAAVLAVLAFRTKKKGGSFAAEIPDRQAAAAALDRCRQSWRKRLAGTTTVRCDDRHIADLLEDWKILMLVQRSEPSGAVSPMVNYRGSWIRDNVGPMLAFLRYGLFDEARALLDFTYDATLVTGRLANHVPLDLDVSKARQIEKTINWNKLVIPGTELPAWVILQHEWYYRATWDIAYIRKHWPFLSACYAAMKPDARGTLPAYGDETYLHGAFFSLWPDRLPDDAMLPADTAERRARSLDSSVLYLIVINAMGEMVEDVDKYLAGQRAKVQGWQSARRQAYENYHLDFMLKLEKAFWLEKEKRFAPFLSPVTGEPHRAPYGPVNLRLQWIGFTYAMGEKNRENLRSTLRALWHRGTRVGMTPTVGSSVGHLQGYLLYNLADLDDKRRQDALDELLELAGPAGEWAELYDEEGRPIGGYDRDWPNRLRPWESGVNIDAIFFALDGIRYACCPGWSKKDQRLKLRTPPGSRWLTIKNARHDGHRFHIYLDEVFAKDLKIEKSGKPVRKMRFRVVYDHINPDAADVSYVDTAVNVGETLYVRYPREDAPLNEQDVWPVDKEEFFPAGSGPGDFRPVLPDPGSARTCVVTARPGTGVDQGFILDTGLPMTPEQFASFFADPSGSRRFDTILVDPSGMRSDRATFKKPSFFAKPVVRAAIAAFGKDGGKLLRPGFFRTFSVVGPFPVAGLDALDEPLAPERPESFRTGTFDAGGARRAWRKVTGDADVFDLARAVGANGKGRYVVYAALVVHARQAGPCVLKLGSDDGVRVWVNGRDVLTRKAVRTAAADQDEVLIRLVRGDNRLLFKVYNDGGGCGLIGRLTDTSGLPLQDIELR